MITEVAVSQSIAGKHIDGVFTFDKVLCPSTRQKDLYEQAVTPIVNEILEGFNCTVWSNWYEENLHYGRRVQKGQGRENKLNSDSITVMNNYQAELAQHVGSLCSTVATALSEQNEHLEGVKKHKICHSFLDVHDKAVVDFKKKVTSLRSLYISHIKAVQNVVRLHKANSDAAFEELTSVISSNGDSIEKFFASEATEAGSIFWFNI